MNDLLAKLSSEDILALGGMLMGLVAILGGFTVAITKVVASNQRKSQLDEMEATLKMEMVQRGISANEIALVLRTRMESPAVRGVPAEHAASARRTEAVSPR
jgi:hypothetical protein